MKKSTTVATMANGLLKVLQRYTKGIRLVAVLTMLFTVGVGSMWGETITFTNSKLPTGWSGTGIFDSNNNHYHSNAPGYALASGKYLQTAEYTNITSLTFWGSTSNGGDGKSLTIQYKEKGSNTWNDLSSIALKKSAQVQKTVTVTSLAGKTVSLKFSTTWNTAYLDDIEILTASQSHTITAQSSNTSYGTVLLSGTTITASPKTGYRVSTTNPYSISPSGSATVEQNGNTFTVTPSANTTITINFEAIPTHKVYFNTGGLVDIESVDVQEGQTYNITQTPASSLTQECEYNTFVGWTKSNTIANPSSKPTTVNSIEMESSDITLYAVYSKTEGGGGSAAEQGTTMFSENWKGCTNNTQPAQPTTSGSAVYNAADIDYVWYTPSGGSKTQTYTSGGPNNNENILISKNNGYWKVVGIPTGQAETLTLSSSKSGSGVLSISTSTSNVSISGSTITIGSSSVNTFDLIFTNTKSGDNLRLDDISVVVAKAGATGSTTYSLTPECATQTSYSVTAGTIQNGSIKFSKTGEGEFTDTQLTGLEEGDYVHFVVNPTLGYTLSGAPSVIDASDNNVECVDMDGIWMFEMPASNVTVSASCTLKEYKITIDDAIENGTASATLSVAVMGTSITLTPKPAAGYQFKSWNVTKEGDEAITVTNNQFTMPASDVTVSAEFTPIIYTITYKNDEYINYTSANPETITIEDKGFELEYSVEDGYELTGVTVTMGGEELVLEEEYLWDKTSMLILPKIDVTGNIVVTFETVATCTQLPTISAATSSDITQTTAMLSCSGISSLGSAGCSITSYGFVWGTTTNPTTSNNKVQVGTTYTTTGTIFSNKLTGLTANTTYYVRPYATNGNGTAYGTEISFKTLDLVKLTTPTNLSVSNLSCSGVTLAWDKVDGASSYQLIRTDKSTSSPITTKVDQKDNPSVYCPLSAGTSWSWTVQAIGDGLTYNSSEVATGEDFTLHYTITYNENGGSIVEDGCGTTLPAELPTPTRNHYNFAGWYMDKELNTPAEAGSVINTNTILYAKWEEIKFTITWSINGNTTNSQEVQEGTTITPPAVDDAATYACEDKVFVGWVGASIDGSTNEEPDFITDFGNVKENKTYYAVFATASGDGFTLGQSGDFTIYANVNGTNYYATGKIGATNNGKIVGTTEEGDANVYTFTAISGNNESYTYNIKQGDDYIKFVKKSNGDATTDLATTDTEYTWTISPGVKGTWRVAAEMAGRAIIFRSDTRLFGGYATSNVTQNQSTYYDIEIGGATTYTEYVTSCVTCENVLTISKGNEENGTFTLDKVGEQETCDGLAVLVTPTPAEHYHVASVTASTGETAVNNGDGTYTITYAANSTGESTINVVFEEDTKYTVTWMVNGLPYTIGAPSTTVYADERVATLPTPPEPNAYCGDVFVGWTTENPASGNFNEAPTVYNEQSAFPPATGNQTFYAVFADYEN